MGYSAVASDGFEIVDAPVDTPDDAHAPAMTWASMITSSFSAWTEGEDKPLEVSGNFSQALVTN